MATEDLIAHLPRLGLDDRAARIYGRLLTGGPAVLDALSGYGDPEDVRAAIHTLIDAGLVGRSSHEADTYVPLPPEAGLRILAARREAELTEATVTAQTAYNEFRRSMQLPVSDNVVEVVTGEAIIERITQAERNAQRGIRLLDSPPHYSRVLENDLELEHLARGIEYRAVYAQASVERPGYFEKNIQPCMHAGEQARVLAEVPVKLSIVDDTTALVGLQIGEADVNQSLLVVRPSSLFSALTGLFELCWQAGLPMQAEGGAGVRLEPVERRLLALLAAGLSDDAITRKLGVSRRTFFRYLERLQAMAGVGSRFQLGVHASREGWLG